MPYGVYDIGQNTGWVNVGMGADTGAFAVQSIRQWWYHMGQARYPRARRLLICADSGGSNGYRHFPPGTSGHYVDGSDYPAA